MAIFLAAILPFVAFILLAGWLLTSKRLRWSQVSSRRSHAFSAIEFVATALIVLSLSVSSLHFLLLPASVCALAASLLLIQAAWVKS